MMHTACPSCGATIIGDGSGCRYCSVQSDSIEETEEWLEAGGPVGWGIDGFALMVALVTTAWPVHAALAGMTPPYVIPSSMMQMDLRFMAAGVCGLLVAFLWRPTSTRGLLVLLLVGFHWLAFMQASAWRSGELILSGAHLELGFQVGAVAGLGALTAFAIRRMVGGVFTSALSARSTPAV